MGVCDIAESCDGVANDCPADGFLGAETECRAALDLCDEQESCTGVGAACPIDEAVDCDDAIECTTDSCNVATGCENVETYPSCSEPEVPTMSNRGLGVLVVLMMMAGALVISLRREFGPA
jgi:hypothetical protein